MGDSGPIVMDRVATVVVSGQVAVVVEGVIMEEVVVDTVEEVEEVMVEVINTESTTV
jgi:hypothetical protein